MFRGPLKRVGLLVDDHEYFLDADQLDRLNVWLAGVAQEADARGIERGLGAIVEAAKASGRVFAGSIDGHLTFSAAPTSLGIVFRVSESIGGSEIDLTDYDGW